ncbi:hypothetical protein SDC9_47214 [bioreactor metagenome]|uniref:Uncharacterized protein n=1 Tax=bioreactor metagenome TaxID=1076179 RepID=A0A644WBT0_9ZZZZ
MRINKPYVELDSAVIEQARQHMLFIVQKDKIFFPSCLQDYQAEVDAKCICFSLIFCVILKRVLLVRIIYK